MREKIAAARFFPLQGRAQRVAVNRDKHQAGLFRKMPCRGFRDLRGGREMDEAVAGIDGRSAIKPGRLGIAPCGLFADFVNRRHTADLDCGATLSGLEHSGNNSYCPKTGATLRSSPRAGISDHARSGVSMLTHAQVWSAIDRLAARAGLSASGLARRAGLEPTTFNKSKPITGQGRARWPSTESIAKALSATGTSFDTFVTLIDPGTGGGVRPVPLLGFAEAGAGGYFDDGGFPAGEGWDEIAFPAVSDEHAYALEVSGQSMEPAYRDGDVVIVSPGTPIRRGDRVVVKTRGGEVMAKELKRSTAKS